MQEPVTLLILSGLPASGKTTLARKQIQDPKWKRVNRDEIRAMLHGDAFSPSQEALTIAVEHEIIATILRLDYHVIVDDTNLNPRSVVRLHELANRLVTEEGLDIRVEEHFLNTDLNECLQRNKLRGTTAPDSAIIEMHKRFLVKGDSQQP